MTVSAPLNGVMPARPDASGGAGRHRVAKARHAVLGCRVDAGLLEQRADPVGENRWIPAVSAVLDDGLAGVGAVELDRVALHAEHLAADVRGGVAAEEG